MANFVTGNEFATGNQVTATTLNAAINNAKISTGSVDDSTVAVSASGVLSVKDAGVTKEKIDFIGDSTATMTLTGSAPIVILDDTGNGGTSPEVNGNSTDGNLELKANQSGAEIKLTTDSTTRLQAGEDVAKDAAGNASQAGIKVTNDIYATGDISADGDVAASVSSDERLKEDIKPIENATDKVNQLSGNTFKWKDCATYNGDDIGVIAQEVQKVIPSAVKERYDGYLKVDYSRIVPLLLQSIKELSQKVETLEAKSHSHGVK